MGKLFTPENIGSGFNTDNSLNTNFTNIETALDDCLSLSGASPNAMAADLDLDNNSLLNIGRVNADSVLVNGVELGGAYPEDGPSLPIPVSGDANKYVKVNPLETGYDLTATDTTVLSDGDTTVQCIDATPEVQIDINGTDVGSFTPAGWIGNVTGNLTGDITGNVTGNLAGNVTGDVTGNLTGNADTATYADNAAVLIESITPSGLTVDRASIFADNIYSAYKIILKDVGPATGNGDLTMTYSKNSTTFDTSPVYTYEGDGGHPTGVNDNSIEVASILSGRHYFGTIDIVQGLVGGVHTTNSHQSGAAFGPSAVLPAETDAVYEPSTADTATGFSLAMSGGGFDITASVKVNIYGLIDYRF